MEQHVGAGHHVSERAQARLLRVAALGTGEPALAPVGALALAVAPEEVRVGGLDEQLEVFETVIDAVKSFA